MEDRREGRKLDTNGPVPTKPDPALVPLKVPGSVPWISTQPVSEVPPVRGPTSPRGCGALNAGAPTVSDPSLRPNLPGVSQHPVLECGLSVLHAADGASGETLCRASQLEIEVLVACADMKRMCGFELARRVGRMRPEVRVLLMWRHFEGPEEAHRAYERGYAVIEEPFTPEELCRRLTGLLALPTQRRLRRAPARR